MQQVFLSSSATDASFQIGNVMTELKSKQVKLDSFEWFNLYQNVQVDSSLRVLQNPGPTTYNITIPKGNYTGDELADTIKAALDTASGGTNYTVTYNTKTFKFDFANGSNQFSLVYAHSTIMPLLGFLTDTAYANSVSSTNVCDLSVIDAIYVLCDLVNDGWKNGEKRNLLGKIQVDKPSGNMIFYRSQTSDDWVRMNSPSNTVRITLADNDLTQITSWGINWNMCLLFR